MIYPFNSIAKNNYDAAYQAIISATRIELEVDDTLGKAKKVLVKRYVSNKVKKVAVKTYVVMAAAKQIKECQCFSRTKTWIFDWY